MISDDVRTQLQQALEHDVERYDQDTLIERHQALCDAVGRVLAADSTVTHGQPDASFWKLQATKEKLLRALGGLR